MLPSGKANNTTEEECLLELSRCLNGCFKKYFAPVRVKPRRHTISKHGHSEKVHVDLISSWMLVLPISPVRLFQIKCSNWAKTCNNSRMILEHHYKRCKRGTKRMNGWLALESNTELR